MKLGIYIAAILMNYLIGSIPFAYIIPKKISGKDIRMIGSGNVGATNVYRAIGPIWGVVVFLLDMLKGYVAAYLSTLIITKEQFTIKLSGFSVNHEIILLSVVLWSVIGHVFPIFLGFRGGKGVSTSCGVFICLIPRAMEVTMVIWIIVTSISRYVSLGSMIGAIFFPILVYLFGGSKIMMGFSLLIALFIILTHIGNIKRIISGQELRIGERPR
jgi:glycerol-3-phosphate acyltransferase PlsY